MARRGAPMGVPTPPPTFDALAYFEKLKAAGVPEEQAKIQASAFRDFSIIQEEKNRQELATKADIQDLRLEMQNIKYEQLKWQIGGLLALTAIMAKGFDWLGF